VTFAPPKAAARINSGNTQTAANKDRHNGAIDWQSVGNIVGDIAKIPPEPATIAYGMIAPFFICSLMPKNEPHTSCFDEIRQTR
jgi:hypothetical protein